MKEGKGLSLDSYFIKWSYHYLFLILGITLLSNIFFIIKVSAAPITWDGGGGDGLWETGTNWSTDAVPTSADQVTINNATVTLSFGQTANFNTLTIGSGVATELVLTGNIGTGGSITIANLGILTQNNTTLQTVTNTFIIQSGGTLRHTANTSTQSFIVNFSANTIDIQSGGSINVDERGYGGGPFNTNGYGPGGGTTFGQAGGGGHGGHGGTSFSAIGGESYCTITNIDTLGSGGAGSSLGVGAPGAGLIILNATSTLTINGTISANGASSTPGSIGGGGAGGGIKLTANIIAGTPSIFSVIGGNGDINGSGGGGGCNPPNFPAIISTSIFFPFSSFVLYFGIDSFQSIVK
jgi:hypothetical protein